MSSPEVKIIITATNRAKEAFEETSRDARQLRQEIMAAAQDMKTGVPGAQERFQELRGELRQQVQVSRTLRSSWRESHEELLAFGQVMGNVGSIGRTVMTVYQTWNIAQLRATDIARDLKTAQERLTAAQYDYHAAVRAGDEKAQTRALQEIRQAQKDVEQATKANADAQRDLQLLWVTMATTQIPAAISQIMRLAQAIRALRDAQIAATAAGGIGGITGGVGGLGVVGAGAIIGGMATYLTGTWLMDRYKTQLRERGLTEEQINEFLRPPGTWRAGQRPIWPPPEVAGAVPGLQYGGLITRPTLAILGERGPELVTPLERVSGGRSISIQTLTPLERVSMVEKGMTPEEVEEVYARVGTVRPGIQSQASEAQRIPELLRGVPSLQLGGLITQPTLAMLGERGPEAVLPLKRVSEGRSISIQTIQIFVDSRARGEDLATQLLAELDRRSRP